MTTLGFTAQLSHNDLHAAGRAARTLDGPALASALAGVRAMTRAHIERLDAAGLAPPYRSGINPPLWECAHVAWFAEWWCVRDAYTGDDGRTIARSASIWSAADGMLDSNRIAHRDRWQLPELTRGAVLDYLDASERLVAAALARAGAGDASLYPFRLALFHEAMHLEAIAWCAQALAWPRPAWVRPLPAMHRPGEIALPAGVWRLGYDGAGFSFDNERDGHDVEVAACAIDHTPVSNAQFAQFVASGEYLARCGRSHPVYWRGDGAGGWQARSFEHWALLDPRAPAIHLSAFEADAYCQWAGRRLPTEAQWERAAATGAIDWGDGVWEWTASTFAPYPGFRADRYREYSEPWFDGHHRVLRGGSHATSGLLHYARYRNYFTPDRPELFAGFRTCAGT